MRAFLRPLWLVAAVLPLAASAQGTAADYARSEQLGQRFRDLVTGVADRPEWIAGSNKFWYRVSVKGGYQFMVVDATAKTKAPAFDHEKLAAALGNGATALTLPMTTINLDTAGVLRFNAGATPWRCTLTDYQCARVETGAGAAGGGRGGRGGRGRGDASPAAQLPPQSPLVQDVDVLGQAIPFEGPWDIDDQMSPQQVAQLAPLIQSCPNNGGGRGGGGGAAAADSTTPPCYSPDYLLEAYIQNHNIFIRPAPPNAKQSTADRANGRGVAQVPTPGAGGRAGAGGGRGAGGRAGGGAPAAAPGWQLSWDGSEGSPYTRQGIRWSPDAKRIASLRVTPGYRRMVRYVVSSPADQLQPEYMERYYQKPGDVVDFREPVMFEVASKKEFKIDPALFPNAYQLSVPQWHTDSRGFTMEYNQRGHQVYRVIEVDTLGKARTLIDETSKTFIDYTGPSDALGTGGRKWRVDVNDGREILWMSERDGWSHLYLYNGLTGQVKNQITKGAWRVQNVQRVDTLKRQIYFTATGTYAGQDPYLYHSYRVNFDGTGLTAFTKEDGTHTVTFNNDTTMYVDSWQRVDLPPVTVLKRVADQSVVMELEKGDETALRAAGFKDTEVFTSKGRDGTTDIWGIVVKPTNFDPSKKYPVIEQIYAGPQGSFVPKTWSTGGATRTLAELGFVVVQIDGMGTTNRSRAFHDVAYKNLGDAGFPDRILWMKAYAAKNPWFDISRVGIYGTSAGGQNALGALLFHPEFYKVAFSAAGCHDNRMDKIWWNEQWMGWPLGPEYAASSNMENASRLQGKLLLVVGELDTNVDPSSTMQVVNALIKANKQFDLLVIPGADHTNGGPYGVRKMTDFFVHNLLGTEPPDRNVSPAPVSPAVNGPRGGR
ncbi:MAG TPA: prolyl oligopeptidase family serine peptidase [Gemmatimonadaceae bacterium]|nr:prolyl oligopeptidase family serine peptidase [Gemmatimonadaceae bacterium]